MCVVVQRLGRAQLTVDRIVNLRYIEHEGGKLNHSALERRSEILVREDFRTEDAYDF